MRRIVALPALTLAVLLCGFGLTRSTYADVTNDIFRVHVVSSFGTTFDDCYRFDFPAEGDLTIDLLRQILTYGHGQLNAIGLHFKAVSRFQQPLSIMFFGEEVDGLEQLNGQAVNEFGDTFVFSGPEVTQCAPDVAATALGSPYSPYRR